MTVLPSEDNLRPAEAKGPGPHTYLVLVLQWVHVEGQEESVEQVVCEHIIEELTVDDQDVIKIV